VSWQEVTVLGLVTLGATAAAIVGSFDPLAVYTGVLGWGAARKAGL
jgi:hypothetical protein